MGILKDKDYLYMLRKLEEVGSSFEFVDFDHERALPASILYESSLMENKYITKDLEELNIGTIDENIITIVTGSLYLISEIREKIGK